MTGLCAVIFAVVALAFCFNDFTLLTREKIYAADVDVGTGKTNTQSSPGQYTFKFSNGVAGETPVYYVEFAGANGGGGKTSSAGRGAVVYGFYKGTSMATNIQGYRGTDKTSGGGYTKVVLNFMNKDGSGEGDSYAAGGGGVADPKTFTISNVYNSKTSSPYSKEFNNGYSGEVGHGGWALGGEPGLAGLGGTHDHAGYSYKSGNAGSGNNGGSSATINNGFSGQGGNGYFGGSSGGYDPFDTDYDYGVTDSSNSTSTTTKYMTNGDILGYTFGGGAGGSSSPNSYPKNTQDYYYFGRFGQKNYSDYWNGSVSTGQGYVKVIRLNASSYPKDVSFVNDNRSHTMPGGTVVSDSSFSGFKTRFIWSTDGGKNWTDWATTAPSATNVGITTVQWRYQIYGLDSTSYTPAQSNDKGIIHQGTAKLIITGAGNAGTLSFDAVNYTGQQHKFITNDPTGATAGATVHYAITTDAGGYYTREESGKLAKNPKDGFTWKPLATMRGENNWPVNAGTYYVHWYVVARAPSGNDPGNTESKVKWTKFTINKSTPTLSTGTLKGTNPKYNGQMQALFTGAPNVTVNYRGNSYNVASAANILYNLSTSTENPNALFTPTSQLSKLCTDAVSLSSYYLWAKADDSANLNGTDWKFMGEVTKSRIHKATLYATGLKVSQPSSRDYNGRSLPFIAGTPATNLEQSIPLNSPDMGKVQYWRWFIAADELAKKEQDPSYEVKVDRTLYGLDFATVNQAKDAGTYELVVTWTGSNNVESSDPENSTNPQDGTHIGTFTIHKADHNITLGSGLTLINGQTIATGGVPLVADGRLECIMDGNMATELNDVIDGTADGNYVSFYWSQDGVNPPNLDVAAVQDAFLKQGPIGGVSGATSMQLLYNYRTPLAGTWYLWIKFDQHRNIAKDTLVRYDFTVVVNNLPATNVTLQDVNGGLRHNDDLPFDARYHQIATGDFLYAEDFIKIDENDVEYNIFDLSANALIRDWTKDKTQLQVDTFGSYFLTVRWGYTTDENGDNYYHENVDITDEAGIRLYYLDRPFKITTKTNFDDLTFGGLPSTAPAEQPHMYDNTAVRYSAAPETALQFFIDYDAEKRPDPLAKKYADCFDIITFGLSLHANVMPTVYSATIPEATDVGDYYLFVSWTGDKANVKNGLKIYNPDEYLSIIKATKEQIKIDNIQALSAADRTYTGSQIPLFGFVDDSGLPLFSVLNSTQPEISGGEGAEPIKNYKTFNLYGGIIKYALTSTDEAPAPTDSQWVATLAEATQLRVAWKVNTSHDSVDNIAPYYLYVMIQGDRNVEDSIYHQGEDWETTMNLQEAYVDDDKPPRPYPNLSYIAGTSQVLIRNSLQESEAVDGIKPPVEYMLYSPGGEQKWVRNTENVEGGPNMANTIKAADPGTYYIFYRGGHDDNHSVEQPEVIAAGQIGKKDTSGLGVGYKYIVVQIQPATASISVVPSSANMVYNGREQLFFNQGYGKIEGDDRLNLVYAVFDHVVTPSELNALLNLNEKDENAVTNQDFYTRFDEYLTKSNTFALYTEPEKLKRTNAGTYTIYYRADTVHGIGENPLQSVQIDIARTRINAKRLDYLETADTPNQENSKFYKADDYALLRTPLVFGFNGTDGLGTEGPDYALTNEEKYWNTVGKIGDIEYGVAKARTGAGVPLVPTTIVGNYLDLTAREAGRYYLYYRVWAGDNHLGSGGKDRGEVPTWICFNEMQPVYILRADSSVVDLSWSTDNFGPIMRYNGQQRTVVTQGDVVLKIGDYVVTDTIGKVQYALTSSTNSPGEISDEWKDTYLAATKEDAGEYYLHVKIEQSDNLTQLIGCVNPFNPAILGKAIAEDLGITGITLYDQMYNGGWLNLAVGNLQVNTIANVGNKQMVIKANILPEVTGYFQYMATQNEPSANWPTEQGLEHATCREVGSYYLYVKIPATDKTEEVVLLVNADPVKITPANEDNIYIVNPNLSEAVEYNGCPHRMILGEANLALRSGNDLSGIRGKAWYYLKKNDSTLPSVNVDLEQSAWTQSYQKITATDRGVYYVFVMFTEGTNHTALKPILAGQVEITKAGASTLLLSGIRYEDDVTYNGRGQPIASGELVLKIDMGSELVTATGAGTVRYAWGNSNKLAPNFADEDWVTDLSQLTAINAGEYYLWVWVEGGDNIASFRACLEHDDHDQPRQYRLIKQAGADKVDLSGIVQYAPHLVYSGLPQQLATGKLVQKINNIEVTSGYIAYGLGSGPNKGQEPTNWVNSLSLITATEATADSEYYYIWVRIDESANIATKTKCVLQVKIDRAKAEVTDIAGAENLFYYQGDQRLLASPGKANFGEVVYRLTDGGNVYDASDWLTDWRDVVGQNAGWYTVFYAVIDNPNWEYYSNNLRVYIQRSTATFIDKPLAKEYLVYNEQAQDLLDFGKLLPEAAAQGCRIKFSYEGDDHWYEYYDSNRATDEKDAHYVWGESGKLPGRTAAGTYTIQYYTTGSDSTNNYVDEYSEEGGWQLHTLVIEIKRREIIWLSRPTARYGLKNTGESQELLSAGMLSAEGGDGATIQYTINKDGAWETNIPMGHGEKIFYCWYRVRFKPDNNYFIDNDELYDADQVADDGYVYTRPQVIQVLMQKLAFSFRGDEPTSTTVTYNATNQVLVQGGELSTSETDVNGVYVNYRINGGTWLGEGALPTAAKIGTYEIEWELIFDENIFEYTGNNRTGKFTSTIVPAVIAGNEIRAIITIDEDNNYNIGFDQGSYSNEFGLELNEVIQYRFRRRDQYFTNDAWHLWNDKEFGFDKNKIGTYEIQAFIDPEAGSNFTAYEQTEPFETFTIAKDLLVNIDIRDKSNPPLLRVWVDLTGNMGYADSPFKTEYNPLDKDSVVLYGVNSPGNGGQGVIRVQCYNEYYYYLSDTLVSDDQKTNRESGIKLTAENTQQATLMLNPGLDAMNNNYTAFIYEVYKITYDANGGRGSLPDAWKWHSVPYELAENNFDRDGLIPDGWSKYSSGSGERFRNGNMYYHDNLSQVFYAQYVEENKKTVLIRWKVGNYEISSTGDWFNAEQEPERGKGMTYYLNEPVYLPDISGLPEEATLGLHILRWVFASENADSEGVDPDGPGYFWGFEANSEEIAFEAVLNNYGDDYINLVFTSEANFVHSTMIANGAQSYMALSGVTASDFQKYDYQKFVDEYNLSANGTITVDSNNRAITYELGAAREPEIPPVIEKPDVKPVKDNNSGATTTMVVLMVIGLLIAAVALTVYLLLRNGKLKIKLKRLKEDKTV